MSTSSTGSLLPQPMMVNQGNPYVNGMRLTYVSTTTFTVGAGLVRDQSNTMDIIMGESLVSGAGPGNVNALPTSIAVTVSLAASTGAGFVDVGTVAANKLYSVFAIGDSRGFSSGSAVISLIAPGATQVVGGVTLPLGPSLPLGYDSWRYIGSVQINNSTHVTVFKQTGAQALRTMWYDSGTLGATTTGLVIPSSATAASQALATIGVLTTIVPQTALEVMVYSSLIANAAGDSLLLTPYGLTAAVTGFAAPAASTAKQLLRVPAAFNGATPSIVEIDYATSSATATVAFTCCGYIDQL